MSEVRNTFDAAVLPDTWRVAGMRLRTHCIGHALLLQRMGTGYEGRAEMAKVFLAETGSIPEGGLSLAVWICRQTSARAHRVLRMDKAPLGLFWCAWRINRYGAAKAHAEFIAYLNAAWPSISWWRAPAEQTRSCGAELLHRLLLTQRRMGLTIAQAMEVSTAVAFWDQAAAAEESGAISLWSDRDRAAMAEAERLTNLGLLPRVGDVIDRDPRN